MEIPVHVPRNLVREYDFVRGPEIMRDPPAALDGIRGERAVFYSGLYGGFWVFTRYEDIRSVYQNHELFKQNEGVPRVPFGRKFIPLRLDPPEHIAYRRVMTPVFAPRQVARMEENIRTMARGRLAEVGPRGTMELVTEFSLALPAAMFCGFTGIPVENFRMIHKLAHDLIYGPHEVGVENVEAARAVRAKAMTAIESLVQEKIQERRQSQTDDAISILMQGKVEGRPLTDDEILNMITLLFFAGIDSTAGAISYAIAFLAQHPEHRNALIARVEDPDYIWAASEELLRFHGFHHIARDVTRDVHFAGVDLKEGDVVILPGQSANRDDAMFPDPLRVDFERSNANRHLTFGAGIHRCIGSHMATAQLRIALQEIHRTIPDYQLADPVEFQPAGPKISPTRVPLRFTPTT